MLLTLVIFLFFLCVPLQSPPTIDQSTLQCRCREPLHLSNRCFILLESIVFYEFLWILLLLLCFCLWPPTRVSGCNAWAGSGGIFSVGQIETEIEMDLVRQERYLQHRMIMIDFKLLHHLRLPLLTQYDTQLFSARISGCQPNNVGAKKAVRATLRLGGTADE